MSVFLCEVDERELAVEAVCTLTDGLLMPDGIEHFCQMSL